MVLVTQIKTERLASYTKLKSILTYFIYHEFQKHSLEWVVFRHFRLIKMLIFYELWEFENHYCICK